VEYIPGIEGSDKFQILEIFGNGITETKQIKIVKIKIIFFEK
jgi:hypothetical protein